MESSLPKTTVPNSLRFHRACARKPCKLRGLASRVEYYGTVQKDLSTAAIAHLNSPSSQINIPSHSLPEEKLTIDPSTSDGEIWIQSTASNPTRPSTPAPAAAMGTCVGAARPLLLLEEGGGAADEERGGVDEDCNQSASSFPTTLIVDICNA